MALKRPGSGTTSDAQPASAPAPTPGAKEVELMEHLVAKSLEINPNLRGGRRTGQIMADLRQQARGTTSENAGAVGNRPKASLADRRRATIAFFLEQKEEEYRERDNDISAREKLLQTERKEAQTAIVEEIVDFLALMSGGGDTPEAREIMKEFKAFLAALGVSESEIVALTQRRK